MKKIIVLLLIIISACAAYTKAPPPNEGTTIEQLKAAGLKPPATVKVAVLPFWDFGGEQRKARVAAVAAFLFLKREGYQMISLWDCQKAYLADKELEPGEQLRKQDALRIGKMLGAEIVCYGETRQVQQKTKYNMWWGYRERGQASIKITLLDVNEGEVIFWGARADEASGQYRTAESARERHAICLTTNRLLEPICKCLPENHQHNPSNKVTEDDIIRLEKAWEEAVK